LKHSLVVKLVLFDLDGTMVHSAPDIAFAANLMLREFGLSQQSYERIAGWIGDGMARLVKRALTGEVDGEPGTELLERGIQRFKAHYAANLTRETECYPGVVVALHELKSCGFTLGCVTNKAEAFTQPLLERLDLTKYLSVIVAGDTVARASRIRCRCAMHAKRPERIRPSRS
jgi:phosphoglycolate phosphatase